MLHFVRGAAYVAGIGTTQPRAYITIGGVLSNRVGGYLEELHIPDIVLGDTSVGSGVSHTCMNSCYYP